MGTALALLRDALAGAGRLGTGVLVLAVAGTLLGGLAFAGGVHAHAVLEETSPADGAQLDTAPAEVLLRFNEPVEPGPEPVRVFNAAGERVDEGDAGHGRDRSWLRVGLRGDLDADAYTVSWQIVSADGHPLRGSFTFTVGEPAAGAAGPADPDENGGWRGWEALAAGLRWAMYLGTLLAAGGAVFLLLAHDRDPAERPRLVRPLWLAAAVGVAASLLLVPAQAILTSGLGLAALLDTGILTATAGSAFGLSAFARACALLLLAVGLRGLWRGWAQGVTAAGALGALMSFLLVGHTATGEPRALVVGANLLHTTAAAVWFGGLVCLGIVLAARRRAGGDAVAGARVVAHFSLLATVSVLLAMAAGVALAWTEIRTVNALVATPYGWAVLAKAALVAAVVALGAYNNRRLVPAVRDQRAERPWRRLSLIVRVEAAALVGVLAVTAVLVNLVPARVAAQEERAPDEAAGAVEPGASDGPSDAATDFPGYEGVYPLGPDHQAHLIVYPAESGTNDVRLHLMDHANATADIAEEVELRFALPDADIAPIARTPREAGPGTYVHTGPELSIAGRWEIEVRVLVSDFELLTATAEVPIENGAS